MQKNLKTYGEALFSKESRLQHFETHSILLPSDPADGILTLFFLAPGIILSYNQVFTHAWPVDTQLSSQRPLLLNYCLKGCSEIDLDNETFTYLSPHQLSFGIQQAKNEYRYPRGHYEGIEMFLDFDVIDESPPPLFTEAGIDLRAICRKLRVYDDLYLLKVPKELGSVFDSLWELLESKNIGYMKVLVAQVFLLLDRQEYQESKDFHFYTQSQIAIAKEIERLVCSDLSRSFTAREFSQRFGVSETSLKNYFRGVFGENISTYIRKRRMEQATHLLESTNLRVSEVADAVGYANQSKFAAVFKDQVGNSPLEYRRTKRLETKLGHGRS